jgi:radical SAM protein with 4Fe4S-binding SPASM domain
MTKKFCYAPWTNIEILPNGDILPCCKFQPSYYNEQFNIATNTIDDFRTSNVLKTIKQEFTNGVWPTGCQRCQIEEDSNIESKRQLDYKRWQEYYDNYDLSCEQLLTVSLAIGNVCNLKCIICNPTASSKWQKEYFDIYNIKIDSIESDRKSIIRGITDIAPNLVHVDIHGGEPFLSGIDEHRALLDHYIETGRAKEISIHYTTNGTIWPTQEWFTRWKYFKEIDLQISIDGIKERYEYLRYPAKWTVLENHVRQYIEYEKTQSNFRLSVAHTVSAYNIYYLDEFVSWCSEIGLPTPWMGKLHNPDNLRPTVWHNDAKMFIINHLESSQNSEVRKWANHLNSIDDSNLFDSFVERTTVHDQYRNLDFKKIFPELGSYV